MAPFLDQRWQVLCVPFAHLRRWESGAKASGKCVGGFEDQQRDVGMQSQQAFGHGTRASPEFDDGVAGPNLGARYGQVCEFPTGGRDCADGDGVPDEGAKEVEHASR